jgi:DinB family protein
MNGAAIFADAYGRIHERVHSVVGGLTAGQLSDRPGPQANSIVWLVWHLTRVQDDHVAEVAGHEQAWTAKGWAEQFALPLDVADTGYGHSSEQVSLVTVSSPDLLLGYHDAVYEQTRRYLQNLNDFDFDQIVDRRWDPPVTLGARLVSVIEDDLMHIGQAAYVAGLLKTG